MEREPSVTRGLAIGITILSAVAFSTKAIFAKAAYSYGVSAIPLVVMRMVMAAPFFALAVLLARGKGTQRLSARDHGAMAGVGLLGYYLSPILDFKGLEFVTASLERTILYTYPTLVTVISFVTGSVRPTKRHLCALCLTYGGLIAAVRGEGIGPNVILGSTLIFACALTFAVYMVVSGPLIRRFGALRFTGYSVLAATVGLGVHAVCALPPESFVQSREVYLLAAGMALFATVLPTFALSFGLGHLGANTTSILSSVGPISTIALSMLLLGERPTPVQWVGVLLVITGVVIATREASN